MNMLDKQFDEMMKGVRIDSPSPDFTLKVMSRIQAEAAVRPQPVIRNYQPVIGRNTWIVLGLAFAALLFYITVSVPATVPQSSPGLWSNLFGKVESSSSVNSFWQKGMTIFRNLPSVVFLILGASMALWTLDAYFTGLRHKSVKA
jgi:hypothetical protein